MKAFGIVVAAVAGIMAPVMAQAAVVTPADLQGWQAANVRGTGTVAITDTYKPAGQQGSLQFGSQNGNDKADFVNSWGLVAGRTLGNIAAIDYSFLRDSNSTVASFLAPAFRLAYYDAASGKSGYLIYEPVYNGAQANGVATDQFVASDIRNSNFWMREFAPGLTIEKYDVTLDQWASGVSQATGAHVLNANTFIYGIEVGVGSGWSGVFNGAVDNVAIRFGASDSVTANFEPAVAAVPEPATWAMLLVGFAMVGAAARYRRRTTVVRIA